MEFSARADWIRGTAKPAHGPSFHSNRKAQALERGSGQATVISAFARQPVEVPHKSCKLALFCLSVEKLDDLVLREFQDFTGFEPRFIELVISCHEAPRND